MRTKIEFRPRGLATGIGSLPFDDPAEALEMVFEYLPEAPHWPQLPARGPTEHFVHQFLQPLVDCGLMTFRDGRWGFHALEDEAECMTGFYASCFSAEEGGVECLGPFLPSPEAAAGWHGFVEKIRTGAPKGARYLKGQIVGPLTVGLELKDREACSAYYDGDYRDIIVRTLALDARSQAETLSKAGLVPMVFVDDPAVSACGSRLHLALDRRAIVEDLKTIFSAIRSPGALAGFHACQAIDWSLAFDACPDILSVDVFRYGESLVPYSGGLKRFLEEGGTLAWGVVPTLDDVFGESEESLWERMRELAERLFAKGPDLKTVWERSMITPSCGMGLLGVEQARRIYRLTGDLSRRVRNLSRGQ